MHLSTLVFVVSFFTGLAFCSTTNPVLFDHFTAQSSLISNSNSQIEFASTTSNTIWGGERDQIVYLSATSNSPSISCTVANGGATISASNISSGGVVFQYDGVDGGMKFNSSTLLPQDLQVGDAKGIEIHVISTDLVDSLISLISSNGSICYYKFQISGDVVKYFADFRFFKDNTGNIACNFSSIVGVELNLIFDKPVFCSITLFGTFENSEVPSHLDAFEVQSTIYESLYSSSQYFSTVSNSTECCFGSIVGGQRDFYIQVNQISNANSYCFSQIANGTWEFNIGLGYNADSVFQFDGPDISNSLVPNGLGKLDFTDGNHLDSLMIQYQTNKTMAIVISAFVVDHYTTSYGSAGAIGVNTERNVIIPFNSFHPPIDFSGIGAIEIIFQISEMTYCNVMDISLVNQAKANSGK